MNTRSVIVYGGRTYTITEGDSDAVRDHISARLREQPAFWLTVNATQGRLTRAQLLITAGTEIAILDDVDDGYTPRFEPATSTTDDISD